MSLFLFTNVVIYIDIATSLCYNKNIEKEEHQDEKVSPPDWCMRVLEAILAKEAGFKGRAEWTDTLKANPETFYSKEYDPQLGFHK